MNDTQYLQHFETGTLHPFHHRDHIRIAWIYLRQSDWKAGYAQIQQGIRRFAAQHGATMLYHETITRFWAHMVCCAIQAAPEIDVFELFEQANPPLFDKTYIDTFYNRPRLNSQEARAVWIEPDLRPLPEC